MMLISGYVLLESQYYYTGIIAIVPTAWSKLLCTGSEDTISECASTPVVKGYHVCDHDQDIFISCAGEDC